MKRTALALTLISVFLFTTIVGAQFVTFTEANFLPPLPQLPHVYIGSDGSIEPKTLPIQKVGNIYTFTGNIFNRTLEIQCSNIIIDGAGYSLQGNGSGKGIYIAKATGVTIRDLKLQKFAYAIVIFESSNNIITGNYITSSGNGIVLHEAKYNRVEDNAISSNGQGLLLYSDCDYNCIVGNSITSNNDAGIWCEGTTPTSDYNCIIGNNIKENGRYGVLLRSAYNSTIVGNNISKHEWGIDLYGDNSRDCLIAENNIAYNEYGLSFFSQYKSTVYHNNFLNNTHQLEGISVEKASEAFVWDDGYPSGGNYWSNYRGTDANGDGIGDTPYIIDENNKDNYPLMAPAIPVVDPPQTSPLQSPLSSPSQEPISSPEAQTPKPFPTTFVAATIVAIMATGSGLSAAYYLRKKKNNKQPTPLEAEPDGSV
jgi:parallel beta-helix repeat protein